MHVTQDNADADSALRRKVARAAGRRPAQPAMFPSRALELALASTAQDVLGLLLTVAGVHEDIETPADITQTIGEHALVALLDGPGDATGLVELSAPFLAAILAQRMTGRQPSTPSVPRPPTRIDAEMTRDLINRTLAEFASCLGDTPAAGWAGGFSYRGYLPDARLLRFALPDIPMRRFRVELDVPGGAVNCTLRLWLPAWPAVKSAAGADASWQATLSENVLGADVSVDAVLTRIRLPLTRIRGLRVDDLVPIPAAVLDNVRLEGPGGKLVANGRLGRSRGHRAVKLANTTGADGQAGRGGAGTTTGEPATTTATATTEPDPLPQIPTDAPPALAAETDAPASDADRTEMPQQIQTDAAL